MCIPDVSTDTTGRTATDDDDFTPLSGTEAPVVFDVGDTSKTVDIYIKNDDGNVDAVDETFVVSLKVDPVNDINNQGQDKPDGYGDVEVTIVNDDSKFCLI